MPKARARLPSRMEGLLRSEWERTIREANLGREDTIIATRYFLEGVPQADISAEFYLDRSTISRRIANITKRLDFAAEKLGLYK